MSNDKYKSTTPQELFEDGPDSLMVNGVMIRKGTIAASFKNAALVGNPNVSRVEKEKALAYLKDILPKLEKAFNMSEVITWNDPEINSLMLNPAK